MGLISGWVFGGFGCLICLLGLCWCWLLGVVFVVWWWVLLFSLVVWFVDLVGFGCSDVGGLVGVGDFAVVLGLLFSG